MQKTEVKEEKEAPKDQPCIFGETIIKLCPVRKDLAIAKSKESDISKWVKPRHLQIEKFFDNAEELLDKMTGDLYYEYTTLVDFYGVCPFLVQYLNRNLKQKRQ